MTNHNDLLIHDDPFYRTKLEEEVKNRDIFTVRFNKEERKELNAFKKFIEQPKDSTALKTAAKIGMLVLHDKKIEQIISILFINRRNNERNGIREIE